MNIRAGLEAKFSLRFAVAMALHGVDTVTLSRVFNDETEGPPLMDTRDKAPVEVAFDEPPADTRVTITTMDGHMLSLDT